MPPDKQEMITVSFQGSYLVWGLNNMPVCTTHRLFIFSQIKEGAGEGEESERERELFLLHFLTSSISLLFF